MSSIVGGGECVGVTGLAATGSRYVDELSRATLLEAAGDEQGCYQAGYEQVEAFHQFIYIHYLISHI